MRDKTQKISMYLWWMSLLLLVFCGGRILYYLIAYGDVYPHWDEWKFVPVKGSILKHLFAYNNENLQFFTNLQYLLVEKLHLSFKSNVFISYGIYLLLVTGWYCFLRQYVYPTQRWLLMLCFLPLFADYMLDNLFWPILSQTWWYFFFMLMAVYFGFNETQNLSFRLKSAVMILCSVLAMNISFVIMFSGCYLLKNIYQAKQKKERKTEVLFATVWLECLAVILFLFCVEMRNSNPITIDWWAVFSFSFYYQFFYLLTAPLSGFFIQPEDHLAAIIIGLLLLGWCLFLFWRQYKITDRQGLLSVAIILGGGIAAIALFRGESVYEITDSTGRYLPYVLFLIPVVFVLGSYGQSRVLQTVNYGIIGVILVFTVWGQFNQERCRITVNRIVVGKSCIENYYKLSKRPRDYFCHNKFEKNISPYLEHFEKVFLHKNSE
ncbi:MAG: hypothetical protein J6W96_04615 [Alphaproteobacteria bacterium]|nr:hypothetical protein [Alphaproteobacteria bacterium]